MAGSFEGVGSLQYSPDNKHAYAYSGSTSLLQDTETTVLEFTTESEYLIGSFQAGRNDKTDAEIIQNIFLNNIQVWYSKMDNGKNPNQAPSSTPLLMVIPPFTKVEWKVESGDNATTGWTGCFVGKVKGAIQQTDLEAISDGSKWIKDA